MYKWNLTIHHSYFIVWSNTGTTIYNGISIENNFHVSLETCNVLTGRSIRKVHMATNKLPKGLLSMKYTWPQVQTLSDRFVNYDFTHGHKYMYKQLQKWSAKYEGTQSHKYKLCLTGLSIIILHMVTNTSNCKNGLLSTNVHNPTNTSFVWPVCQLWYCTYEHSLTDLLILKSMAANTNNCKNGLPNTKVHMLINTNIVRSICYLWW